MPTITVLDDYQQAALTSADWSAVQKRFSVVAISEHIADDARLVGTLSDSVAVVAMRERTPLPVRVLAQPR